MIYELHPDIAKINEGDVLLPGARLMVKGELAVIADRPCPECAHVGGPYPIHVRILTGPQGGHSWCACCSWLHRDGLEVEDRDNGNEDEPPHDAVAVTTADPGAA